MNEQQLAAAQPAQDNTYGYAKSLAESLFKKHYAHEEPYASGSVVWEVSDTTIGVLTQIDNMVCTLVHQPAPVQEPVATLFGSLPVYDTTPPAAPVQEPVAVVSGYYGGQCVVLPINPARLFNSGTAFYTAPPAAQKLWVGLTDEEAQWIYDNGRTPSGMMEMVEAKLKEKNA
jgi:hypothetical protein